MGKLEKLLGDGGSVSPSMELSAPRIEEEIKIDVYACSENNSD